MDDLVAELTLRLRNDMNAGIDEVREAFAGIEGDVDDLRGELQGLDEALQAMRAPDSLVDSFADVVTGANEAADAVREIGVAVAQDTTQIREMADAMNGVRGGGGGAAGDDDDAGGGGGSGAGVGGGRGGKGGGHVTDLLSDFFVGALGFDAAESTAKSDASFDWLLTHIAITEKLSGSNADAEKQRIAGMLDQLATQTGNSSTDLADAYYFLVTTGMNKSLINQLMPSLAETSTAYNVAPLDQAQSVFTLSDVLGIAPADMPKALATLSYAAKLGHFGIGDFGHYLPGIGAQLSILGDTGISGEVHAAAALETVRRVTGTSEEDATDVQDLINYVSSPIASRFFDRTARSKSLLGAPILHLFEKYHVPAIDIPQFLDNERDHGVSSLDAMVDLAKKIWNPNMTPTDQREIFGALFHNQQAAMAALGLVENYDTYKADEKALAGVTPQTVATDSATASAAPEVAMRKFDESLVEASREIGQVMIPSFEGLTTVVIDFTAGLKEVTAWWEKFVVPPVATALGTSAAFTQHEIETHPNGAIRSKFGYAAPIELHVMVHGSGQVTAQATKVPPGVNLRVNQGHVLDNP